MLLIKNFEDAMCDVNPKSQKSSGHYSVDLSDLNLFQRILLQTDGTLTEMLENYLGENISVLKITEDIQYEPQNIFPLNINNGQEIIKRKILLQGENSRKNWLYADSVIVLDRLEKNFREELITSGKPIGKLWKKYKIETYKEIISYFREPAAVLSKYFDMSKRDDLLCRTYRVFSNRKPVMMITEKFPESYFV